MDDVNDVLDVDGDYTVSGDGGASSLTDGSTIETGSVCREVTPSGKDLKLQHITQDGYWLMP